jgi:hypothetical protein
MGLIAPQGCYDLGSAPEDCPNVAKSYELIESLERLMIDQQNHSLPKEVEKLSKDRPTG